MVTDSGYGATAAAAEALTLLSLFSAGFMEINDGAFISHGALCERGVLVR